MQIKVGLQDNFELWEKFLLFQNYKNMMIAFIDNGVLEKNNLTKDIFYKYENAGEIFYNSLINTCKTYNLNIKETEQIASFDLDFIGKIYNINIEKKESFDKRLFAINSLQLLEEYKFKLIDTLNIN